MILMNSLASILGCTVAGGLLFSLQCFSQSLISFAFSIDILLPNLAVLFIDFLSFSLSVDAGPLSVRRCTLRLHQRAMVELSSNESFSAHLHLFEQSNSFAMQPTPILPTKHIVFNMLTTWNAINQCQNSASQSIQRNSWCSV
jgi:hypothetical protein